MYFWKAQQQHNKKNENISKSKIVRFLTIFYVFGVNKRGIYIIGGKIQTTIIQNKSH